LKTQSKNFEISSPGATRADSWVILWWFWKLANASLRKLFPDQSYAVEGDPLVYPLIWPLYGASHSYLASLALFTSTHLTFLFGEC
jgi:hypothetical protein